MMLNSGESANSFIQARKEEYRTAAAGSARFSIFMGSEIVLGNIS